MAVKMRFVTARQILVASFFLVLLLTSACGTLDVSVEESVADQGALDAVPTISGGPTRTPGASELAVAWYGSVHSVPGSGMGDDYLKLWHLAIWPKFGRAVGLTGADPAINAEIERLRDRDIKATFWGDLTCNVADYGGCQLLVRRISADDGGPQYELDWVEGWTGQIGRLPVQPGSQNDLLYFVLDGPVTVLYGIAGDDPALRAELERLAGEAPEPGGGGSVRIWGELHAKAQAVTGTVIRVERLESVSP
jgi:hypothetical protein